jgi:type I restriction enzyme M protein
MKLIETDNKELDGVLPKSYNRLENSTLATLLKSFNAIPMGIEGDVFGKIYEYFLGQFAKAEGQRGGEFFTPTSLVKLIVEVIEPYHGRIFDPASGSGGMFVQSANFVARHQGNPSAEISLYGQEKTMETVRLARMNLAVNGLEGDVRQGNTYYEDLHRSGGKFDFVMANPPFNVNNVDKERLKDDPRFPFGLPRTDNANYLWIQLFYSALNERGRAGFVMANSASDARQSELEIRRKLIEAKAVDVMIAIGSNFFLTVTLPCTLWFLDRGKTGTPRENTVLFIDARPIYRQVDRALREFTDAQVAFVANIVRLYRGEQPDWTNGSGGAEGQGSRGDNGSLHASRLTHHGSNTSSLPDFSTLFPTNTYRDIPGLCKVATLAEIESQGWSLNPGRYVGVADRAGDDGDFAEQLEELNEELELLNAEARELEARIGENVGQLLNGFV